MRSSIALATIAVTLATLPAVSGSAPRTLGNGCCDEIWSISPSGKQQQQLLINTTGGRGWLVFDLSPDRDRIVFWACTQPSYNYCADGSLFTASIRGQRRRAIIPHVGASAAQWSPDGKRILFAKNATYCCPDGPTQLAVAGAKGTGLRTVAECAYCDLGVWAPDSRRVAYVKSQGPEPQFLLKVKSVDSAGARVVAHVPSDRIDLSWSPGGRWLAYDAFGDRGPVLRVVRVDGSRDHAIGSIAENAPPGAWSPEGRRLAFVGPNGLVIANLDGSHRRLLDRYRPFLTGCCGPAWSPDGREIAYFDPKRGENSGYLTVIAPTGHAKHLLAAVRYTDRIFWARDGRRIYYAEPSSN